MAILICSSPMLEPMEESRFFTILGAASSKMSRKKPVLIPSCTRSPARRVITTDFNNDRAIDLIFSANKPELFLNPRDEKWNTSQMWDLAKLPPVNAAVTLDFDKDGWMDVALSHDGAPAITLWRNANGRSV